MRFLFLLVFGILAKAHYTPQVVMCEHDALHFATDAYNYAIRFKSPNYPETYAVDGRLPFSCRLALDELQQQPEGVAGLRVVVLHAFIQLNFTFRILLDDVVVDETLTFFVQMHISSLLDSQRLDYLSHVYPVKSGTRYIVDVDVKRIAEPILIWAGFQLEIQFYLDTSCQSSECADVQDFATCPGTDANSGWAVTNIDLRNETDPDIYYFLTPKWNLSTPRYAVLNCRYRVEHPMSTVRIKAVARWLSLDCGDYISTDLFNEGILVCAMNSNRPLAISGPPQDGNWVHVFVTLGNNASQCTVIDQTNHCNKWGDAYGFELLVILGTEPEEYEAKSASQCPELCELQAGITPTPDNSDESPVYCVAESTFTTGTAVYAPYQTCTLVYPPLEENHEYRLYIQRVSVEDANSPFYGDALEIAFNGATEGEQILSPHTWMVHSNFSLNWRSDDSISMGGFYGTVKIVWDLWNLICVVEGTSRFVIPPIPNHIVLSQIVFGMMNSTEDPSDHPLLFGDRLFIWFHSLYKTSQTSDYDPAFTWTIHLNLTKLPYRSATAIVLDPMVNTSIVLFYADFQIGVPLRLTTTDDHLLKVHTLCVDAPLNSTSASSSLLLFKDEISSSTLLEKDRRCSYSLDQGGSEISVYEFWAIDVLPSENTVLFFAYVLEETRECLTDYIWANENRGVRLRLEMRVDQTSCEAAFFNPWDRPFTLYASPPENETCTLRVFPGGFRRDLSESDSLLITESEALLILPQRLVTFVLGDCASHALFIGKFSNNGQTGLKKSFGLISLVAANNSEKVDIVFPAHNGQSGVVMSDNFREKNLPGACVQVPCFLQLVTPINHTVNFTVNRLTGRATLREINATSWTLREGLSIASAPSNPASQRWFSVECETSSECEYIVEYRISDSNLGSLSDDGSHGGHYMLFVVAFIPSLIVLIIICLLFSFSLFYFAVT